MRRWFRKKPKGSVTVTTSVSGTCCPVCKERGERSDVVQDYGDGHLKPHSCTAWWDGNGDQHLHGGTWAAYYLCSKGHRWMTTGMVSCPAPKCNLREASPETIVLHDEGVRWL